MKIYNLFLVDSSYNKHYLGSADAPVYDDERRISSERRMIDIIQLQFDLGEITQTEYLFALNAIIEKKAIYISVE